MTEKQEEFEERVMWCIKEILKGNSAFNFVFQEAKKVFRSDISRNSVERWYKQAKLEIRAMRFDNFQEEFDVHVNRLEGLYNMNLKIQDFEGARKVLSDKAKLLGLNKEDHLQTSHTGDGFIGIKFFKVNKEGDSTEI